MKMLNRKHVILAAASLAALPLAANAVVITMQFDMADFVMSTTAAGTYTTVPAADISGTAAAPVLTVPIGTYIEYGLDAEITGNGGLGLAAFQTGVTNSTGSATTTSKVATPPTAVNPFFSTLTSGGTADGMGGVAAATGTAGSYIITGQTSSAKATFGANAFANLYNSQRIVPLAANNSSFTLAVTDLNIALQYVIKAGTTSGVTIYGNQTFVPVTDTLSPLPVLKVNYGAAVTGPTAQPIISLLATAPTTYGSQLGQTIALTYTGPGGYVPGATTFGASNKGYGVVTGFHSPDTEIYALDVLNASGGVLTSAQITAVISDINASESGVTASLVTGIYAHLFPGYDVLLTSTGTPPYGTDYLGIDFSATGDQDPATQGFTVGAIAAVPEPATMTLGVIGAAGLLLGRRKSRSLAA